ncbi:MAG: RNA methyltransferase [Chlamydiales bacterium]|nr:RNA methyltransferase [Chlamydiales bacterium]
MITSLQHPIVKHFVELRKDKAARLQHQEVILAGEKLVRELSCKEPLDVLMTLKEAPEIAAKEKYIVSPEILKKVTGLSEPDGFAASIKMPKEAALEEKQKILILDQISDPGNIGTLFRSALALGWDGIWLTPNTVDPFNDKAIRAARGANFSLPFAWKSFDEICAWAKTKRAHLYIADIEGRPITETTFMQKPAALILSNESHGPRPWPAEHITIPMQPQVESLNVAISGAILLFALRNNL